MDEPMQVIVSVGGRFHAFELARELECRGSLRRLITAYPRFEVIKHGIPRDKISAFPAKEILFRGWKKLPPGPWKKFRPHYLVGELFERQARRALAPCDIFVGWSGFSLGLLKSAGEQGAVTVLERGSSHIETQTELLREEYLRFGIKPILAHPRVIAKELREYDQADYIAIPSDFVRKSFLQRGIPDEKLIQVPYGVSLDSFYPHEVPDDGIFRVVYAGRLCLRKGVQYLLQAFSELDLEDSELLLLGGADPEFLPFLKKYSGRVSWLGRRPREKLPREYSRSSVFVMPSIEEGMAMVQVQAMACGLPLICTPNSGGEDLISEGVNGFIVPIRDPEAIKERIRTLYHDRVRCSKMGAAARARVADDFTWQRYGARVYENYRRILKERRGR